MTALILGIVAAIAGGVIAGRWIRKGAAIDAFMATEAGRHCAEAGHDYRADPGTGQDVCQCCGGYQLRRWTT